MFCETLRNKSYQFLFVSLIAKIFTDFKYVMYVICVRYQRIATFIPVNFITLQV